MMGTISDPRAAVRHAIEAVKQNPVGGSIGGTAGAASGFVVAGPAGAAAAGAAGVGAGAEIESWVRDRFDSD